MSFKAEEKGREHKGDRLRRNTYEDADRGRVSWRVPLNDLVLPLVLSGKCDQICQPRIPSPVVSLRLSSLPAVSVDAG